MRAGEAGWSVLDTTIFLECYLATPPANGIVISLLTVHHVAVPALFEISYPYPYLTPST